jgi:hypothetical protein
MKRHSLKAWLRRDPQPHTIKVRLGNDEEKTIAIPSDARTRWKVVEASILAANGVSVELLDKEGTVIRGQQLEALDENGVEIDKDGGESADRAAQTRDLKEYTTMLQAVMAEQNKSFEKGVSAASQSQSSLVELVESMAEHLSTSFVSLHNVVANMANMQQQYSEQTSKLMMQLAEARAEQGEEAGPIGEIVKTVAPVLAAMSAGQQAPNGQKPPQGKKP